MAAGEARRLAAGTARKYRILDKRNNPYWHAVFEGNPNVARPHEKGDGAVGFVNGHRAYIADETKQQRTFREYRPTPAFLAVPRNVQHLANLSRGAVVFHPGIKANASPNKDWGWGNWEELVEVASDVRWVQLGEPGVPRIPKAEYVPTSQFWEAIAVLSGAMAAVVHEGALHHASAALGVRAVVLYGGYIGPRVTGYDGQVALFHETEEYPLGCGMRVPCEHCKEAMASITPAMVLEALRGLPKSA